MNWPLLIIDATAGYRLMWRNKDMRWTVFLDKRRECRPDIVCDNGVLPLRDDIANEIIYDPPHWVRVGKAKELIHTTYKECMEQAKSENRWQRLMIMKYGYWNNKTGFISNLHKTNREFRRIAKPNTTLTIKLCEMSHTPHIGVKHIQEFYTNWVIKSKREMRSGSNHFNSRTIWLTLKLNSSFSTVSNHIQGGI